MAMLERSQGSNEEPIKREVETPIPLHMLLVDDDHDFNQMMSMRLEVEETPPKSITIAKDGEEALGILADGDGKTHTDINAILLDLNLPGRNGIEIAREIRSRKGTKKIAIIMLSSDKEFLVDHYRELKEAGIDDGIPKTQIGESPDLSNLMGLTRNAILKREVMIEQENTPLKAA